MTGTAYGGPDMRFDCYYAMNIDIQLPKNYHFFWAESEPGLLGHVTGNGALRALLFFLLQPLPFYLV